jgi:hypothetical protein
LSVINSSCNRGVDIGINFSGLLLKYWTYGIYDNTRSSGLEVGATWQYSISGDNGFTNGTGSSFTLTDNTTYEANTIQIRQTDIAGTSTER